MFSTSNYTSLVSSTLISRPKETQLEGTEDTWSYFQRRSSRKRIQQGKLANTREGIFHGLGKPIRNTLSKWLQNPQWLLGGGDYTKQEELILVTLNLFKAKTRIQSVYRGFQLNTLIPYKQKC